MSLILLLATISLAQAIDPAAEAAKLQPGAYYWTGMSWQVLEPVEWSAGGIRKSGKSSVFTYRHPRARVQLSEGTPLFCYRLPHAAPAEPAQSTVPDFVIARLDQKKDSRELEIASGKAAFAFSAGSTKRTTPEITVTGVASDLFLVSPKEPLSPGEYVIGGSSLALFGFDFGIRSNQ